MADGNYTTTSERVNDTEALTIEEPTAAMWLEALIPPDWDLDEEDEKRLLREAADKSM
jgi:hypothetical protein